MKAVIKLGIILLLASGVLQAQTTTPKKKASTPVHSDVQALKDALAAQQEQIKALAQQLQQTNEQLQETNRQFQQTQQQLQAATADAASKAAAAQTQASQEQQTVGELKGDVADLKTNYTNTAVTLQETQKSVKALESPLALHFKGVTLTPGGYLDGTFTRRSRALAEEAATPFNSVQMPGAAQGTMAEFFGSGRQSRITLLTEGKLNNAKLSGYLEADFLSAGVTSTSTSTNGYTLRQRQVWGQAAFDNGWSFTGGQQWSLATETARGLDNRSEALPMTIDSSYNVGFTLARQYGLRLVKNIDNKVWFGVSMENSQATVGTHGNASNFLVGTLGDSKAYNTTATYSFNPSPDIVAKVAFEPGFGHYEVFGLFSRFRDRVYPCEDTLATTTAPLVCDGVTITGPSVAGAYNASKNGGGIGANARWAFADKRVVFGLHGFGGSGVGRYGTGGLPDASVHADGTLHLVREFQGLSTLEWHGKKLDIYSNVGAEYAARTWDVDNTTGTPVEVGYGAPGFNNSGCYTETVPGSGGFAPGAFSKCTADTRALIEGTLGFWYRFYKGPRGTFQYGTQYSYVSRNAWSGVGATTGPGTSGRPSGIDTMVFASFRYYLP
jgi:TolA-binding protein